MCIEHYANVFEDNVNQNKTFLLGSSLRSDCRSADPIWRRSETVIRDRAISVIVEVSLMFALGVDVVVSRRGKMKVGVTQGQK